MKRTLLALACLLVTTTTNAAPILSDAVAIQAVSVIATTNYGAPYTAQKTIDQGGMSATYTSGITAASAIDGFWVSDSQQVWHGSFGVSQGSLTYDLGDVYTLDRIFLFWTNGGSTNNISDFNIDVSDDANFTSFITAATFSDPSGGMNRVDFSSVATGQFVRLEWNSIQGDYPGLAEFVAGGVAYNGATVPEPASLALLGLGLAGLGFSRRKS